MAKTRTDDQPDTDTSGKTKEADGSSANGERPLPARAIDAVKTAPDVVQHAASAVAERAPEVVQQTANVVAEHAPEMISASQTALSEASRRIQDSSTEQLTGWASFAIGLWVGLMVGRVPRIVSLLVGLPALVLAGALVARRGGMRSSAS
jgi:hypothetical protein